ncbi:CvpA family protein, partial [Patescibacteria group bacterium]|nr:CvpA family protein [Patescibacteria group bacterium]
MGLIDIILLILLFGFIFYGLFFGLVQTLGGLVGVFLGVIIAGRFFEPVAEWAQVLCWGNLAAAKVICFVLIFILVNRGVGLIFHVIDK